MSKYLPYLYLQRFPLLTALILVALTLFSLRSVFTYLLHGLYDLKPWGFFFVVLASLLTAWTAMVTFWIIAAYAPARFGTPPLGVTFPPGRVPVVLFAVLAVPVWIGVFHESVWTAGLVVALIAGIAIAALILWAVNAISKLPLFDREGWRRRSW